MYQDTNCMEVGLSPDDIVLDGDSARPPKRGTDPNFWPILVYVVFRLFFGVCLYSLFFGIADDGRPV